MLNIQFELKDLFSPKVLYPAFVVLLFVVYTLGRSDGASKKEIEFETYRVNSEKIVKNSHLQRKQIMELEKERSALVEQNKVLINRDVQIQTKLNKMQKTLDSLNVAFSTQVSHLPGEVPPVCSPWVDALNTCKVIKQQLESKVDTLKEQVVVKNEQIKNKDGQISNLIVQDSIAIQRGDSLEKQLGSLPKPEVCKVFIWFGPKCPSRTTMTVISGTLGIIAGFLLHSHTTIIQ